MKMNRREYLLIQIEHQVICICESAPGKPHQSHMLILAEIQMCTYSIQP